MLDWLACTLVKLAGALFCRLPPSVAVWCGERLGSLAYWVAPTRTGIGVLNVRAAFDGRVTVRESRRIIYNCYKQLGAGVIELLRLPVIDAAYVERYITIEGRDRVERAAASGRPVVFLTGHFGNWELSSIVAALIGHPITALARIQDKFPRLYRLLISYRESKGCTIVHKGGAMKRLIATLDQRQFIGIVGDQASRQGIFVDFFGRPALFATGPFDLAYTKRAIILPAFTHRVRGPFHRIVVEPPLEWPDDLPKEAAVSRGIEQFAKLLGRHIESDPGQWLWMHKRWKHTPARRILVLSDGKAGHLRQSLAVVEAIRDRRPEATHDVVEVRYRSRLARAVTVAWSWWMPPGWGATRCLGWTLTQDSGRALLCRYADVIVSCGASTAPANLLWTADNRAKSVVLMNPSPLPLRRFNAVIAPAHDGLPRRPNIVEIAGAMSCVREDALRQARHHLTEHPQFRRGGAGRVDEPARPVVSLFVGGDTAHYELTAAFAQALVEQTLTACEALDGSCLVTTSRRTSPAVEQQLGDRLARHARCRLLLLASRDALNGTMDGMLGWATVAVVTGESISMVSEACASGRPVVVIEPPLRRQHSSTRRRPTAFGRGPGQWCRHFRVGGMSPHAVGRVMVPRARPWGSTKHQRFLQSLLRDDSICLTSVAELSAAIQRALQDRQSAKRLENFAVVRDALDKLL